MPFPSETAVIENKKLGSSDIWGYGFDNNGKKNRADTNLFFDEDELMLLQKAGVITKISSGNGNTYLHEDIINYVNEFVRSNGFATARDKDNSRIISYFDVESVPDTLNSIDKGYIRIKKDMISLFLDGPKFNDPTRKQFLIDLSNEILKGVVVFLAKRDAAKSPPSPDDTIINLSTGKHSDLAKLYLQTYSGLTRSAVKKPGLFSGMFGKSRRKTRKHRSRKHKKTRKH
jgi:hypothetical protein